MRWKEQVLRISARFRLGKERVPKAACERKLVFSFLKRAKSEREAAKSIEADKEKSAVGKAVRGQR